MWGNLLIGVVTGLVALSGVIYTQWRADQREQQRWDRERAHEKAIWGRDDAARSYEHRRDAYVTFLTDYEEMGDLVWGRQQEIEYGVFEGDPEPPEDLLAPLGRRLKVIQVFGTRAAFDTASKAFDVLRRWVFGSSERRASWHDVEAARDAYVDQLRQDLHVSDE